MNCKILSLFFLVGYLTAFGSDSGSGSGVLRQQVRLLRSDADIELIF